MISDVELDRILTSFLAEGADRAPGRDVRAALAVVADVPQRRGRRWGDRRTRPSTGRRWLVIAAVVTVLGAALAIGVGAGIIRMPSPPDPRLAPNVTPSEAVRTVELVPFSAADWAVSVNLPPGWIEAGEPISEFRHFGGTDPEGHLSVTNESPYGTTICQPDCVAFDVPTTIPYDAADQLAGLRASVGSVAGSQDWQPLSIAADPAMVGGARLDTVGSASDGRAWRRIHVTGLKDRNVVAIAWSQPVEVFDEALFEAVLAGIVLGEAPVYSDGDLMPWTSEADFRLPLPGLWQWADQPDLGGTPLSGVRRFADGRVLVSIGATDGTLGWCDPACRLVDGATSLDALESAVRSPDGAELVVGTTLGGEPARQLAIDGQADRRRTVIAMHGGRPVAVRLDAGTWVVRPGVFDSIIDGFAFADPAPAARTQTFSLAGGRVEIILDDAWHAPSVNPERLVRGVQTLTVRIGDAQGRITTCAEPAGPWDPCGEVTATTLDALVAAVRPTTADDHGVGPPVPTVDDTTLGGEPARIIRIQAYEYPAQGGQAIAIVVAMHDGRPVILRLRTRADRLVGVGDVLSGFRFVDRASPAGG